MLFQVSRKELKIVQLVEKKKGKTEKIKYPPIPGKDVTYAVQVSMKMPGSELSDVNRPLAINCYLLPLFDWRVEQTNGPGRIKFFPFLTVSLFFRPQTKLWEGNLFTCVCLCVTSHASWDRSYDRVPLLSTSDRGITHGSMMHPTSSCLNIFTLSHIDA